ncbi:O-methyltransferase [Leptolyngbya sp. NIES-2104]|uniref:O-methyltransferase n=1 Tax=Leptolyngbya sp. NIES-2104 TaxID=1552121 RepID=UPI0006ECC21B|nr:hypothetical protein [Leptolyngbya sp. NIES-2104]GAP99979.1 cytidine/deoxycytidylate deaminase/nudix/methyltransferase domains protein [Leptolyngbya sp. NIES-2104]
METLDQQKDIKIPKTIEKTLADTSAIDFQMTSEPLTGVLLRTLAASKPAGRFLELGTGTGVSTAWLLDGMDQDSEMITVERDRSFQVQHSKAIIGFYNAMPSLLTKCQ